MFVKEKKCNYFKTVIFTIKKFTILQATLPQNQFRFTKKKTRYYKLFFCTTEYKLNALT